MEKFSRLVLAFFVSFSLLSTIVLAATVMNSPSACSGGWKNCANAFGNNANVAEGRARLGVNTTGVWNNYGFSIQNNSVIDNMTVRADFFATKNSGFLNVRVSGDGGVNYGTNHVVGGNLVEQTFLIDVTNDLAWTPEKLNNGNLRVQATCFTNNPNNSPTCKLDWIPVQVSHTPFDFSVSTNPISGSVQQGNSVQTTITVNLLGGVSQNVVLSSSGCPTFSTCSFNPSSGNPTYSSTFTVATTSSTSTGNYSINITGTGDGKSRTTTYTLSVTAADSQPNATADANPRSGTTPLTVNFTGTVSGGDSPLTFFWDFKDGTNSTQQNPQHTFTTAGTYNVTFTVNDFDGDSDTDNVIITVNEPFDFSVSVNPAEQNVTQGFATSTVVTVSLLSGQSQTVSLSQAGCPPSSFCFFTNPSGNPTFTSNFTVFTNSSTPLGTYPINITGTGGGKTHTTTYTLNVN